MKKPTEDLKETILSGLKAKKSVLELAKEYNVSRTTIYRWKKEEAEKPAPIVKDKEVKLLLKKVSRLEEIIQIIKEAECLPTAPLRDRLYALERIYGTHSVHILCEALEVDRGTFYNHLLRNKKTNTWYAKQREELRVAIQRVYDENRQLYGSGKITAVLKAEGYHTCENTVRRLMTDMGIKSVRQRTKALYEKERKSFCKNIVNQNFTAERPNQIWVSDVTCYHFQEKNYFICAILDLFSRMVIGYKIGLRNSTQLVKATFKLAYESRKPPKGLIFHTDRGTNYRSHAFVSYLRSLGVVQSFSRAHIPYDNSVVESFFSSFKKEELYRWKYKSKEALFSSIDEYIIFYNTKRIHYNNKYKTPLAKELAFSAEKKNECNDQDGSQ